MTEHGMRGPRSENASPWFPCLLLTGLYVLPVLACLQPIDDPDLWWHLRLGEHITTQQEIPTTDPLSQVGEGKEWLAYSWLFEVLGFKLHQAFGLMGIFASRMVLALLILLVCHRMVIRREPRFWMALLLTGCAFIALTPLMRERPWLFTILFAFLTQSVVLRLREGEGAWYLWLLPLAYILWANIHIQFVYGLLLLGLAWMSSPSNRRVLLMTVLCGLATLINPFHVRIYGVIIEYASQSFAFRYVSELTALTFRDGWDWMVLALALLSAYRLGQPPRGSLYNWLLLIVAAFFCFRAKRDLWMMVLAAMTILPGLLPAAKTTFDHIRIRRSSIAIIAVAVLLLATGLPWLRGFSEEALQSHVVRNYPYRATEIIRERQWKGPLFNTFNWGGYLAWRLPGHRVAIDGRTNLHGEERILRFERVWSGLPEWEHDPNLSASNLIVAPRQSALASLLRWDARFRIEHEDELAVVFVQRNTGGNR